MAKETITNRVITGVLVMIIGSLLLFIGNYALEGFTSKIITVISAKFDKHIQYSDSLRIIKENADLEEKNKAIIKEINNNHKQDLLIKDVKKICKILNLDSYSERQPVELKSKQEDIFNYDKYMSELNKRNDFTAEEKRKFDSISELKKEIFPVIIDKYGNNISTSFRFNSQLNNTN